jgi:hypothetical protein
MLNDGMDIYAFAVQMGTSIRMIEQHYSNLTSRLTFARLGGIVTVGILAEAQFAYAVPSIYLLSLVTVLCALAGCKGFSAEPDTGFLHFI